MLEPMHFWGKASPASNEEDLSQSHPLIFHSLDVAAVFEALLESDRTFLDVLTTAFKSPAARIIRPLTALVALHDIGKVSRKFQAKSEDAWPPMLGPCSSSLRVPYDHAAGSAELLLKTLQDLVAPFFDDVGIEERTALMLPIAYHHGKPQDRHPTGKSSLVWGDAENARAVAAAILAAVKPKRITPLPQIGETAAKSLSWRLSGLVSLADWIGSSTDFFRYRNAVDFVDAREYWLKVARTQTQIALTSLRIAQAQPNPKANFSELFKTTWEPSAAQSLCGDLSLTPRPTLVFIEDVTGGGKTESALLLAQRMRFCR